MKKKLILTGFLVAIALLVGTISKMDAYWRGGWRGGWGWRGGYGLGWGGYPYGYGWGGYPYWGVAAPFTAALTAAAYSNDYDDDYYWRRRRYLRDRYRY